MQGSNRQNSRKQSRLAAFCGMLVALSVILMLTGGLIPVMTYVSPLAASLLLLPIMAEFGAKYAWTAFAVTSFIVILLGVDKEAAFFYLFLGYYPLVKWRLDKLRSKPLRLILKLAIFTAAAVAMYALLAFVLHLDAVLADFKEMGQAVTVVFFVMLDVCMLLYDRMLFPMLILYTNKVKPKLRFLR